MITGKNTWHWNAELNLGCSTEDGGLFSEEVLIHMLTASPDSSPVHCSPLIHPELSGGSILHLITSISFLVFDFLTRTIRTDFPFNLSVHLLSLFSPASKSKRLNMHFCWEKAWDLKDNKLSNSVFHAWFNVNKLLVNPPKILWSIITCGVWI